MKKRILIVNKFYYNRGGDCVMAMALEQLLRANGYDVAVFAMQYPENVESEYTKYFARRIDFAEGCLADKVRALKRMLGWGDIRSSFEAMLRDFRPDVVHLNNIHSYLSPVVAELAKAHGCRVVWTMHDYKLVCPSYICLREGKPCEECFADKSQVLRKRCMKGSAVASAMAWLEAVVWNRSRLQRCTDVFVCPSQFMAKKMEQGGFDAGRLKVVCNFADPQKLSAIKQLPEAERKPYYCYVGRLSEEKGIDTLLKAAAQLPYTLKVAGSGPLLDEMRARYAGCENIEFLGRLNGDSVVQLLAEARLSVLTSEWYENNPLGVIESLCAGTPVVGSHYGGIPELIEPDTGVIYEGGDVEQLKQALTFAFTKDWHHDEIKRRSLQRFSPEEHLRLLEKIYEG